MQQTWSSPEFHILANLAVTVGHSKVDQHMGSPSKCPQDCIYMAYDGILPGVAHNYDNMSSFNWLLVLLHRRPSATQPTGPDSLIEVQPYHVAAQT